MSSGVGSNGERPWEGLPNPFGFPTLAEAAKDIRSFDSRSIHSSSSLAHQRTSTVGRDWMGVGFQQGDLVLASTSQTLAIFEVDTIFLDDSVGRPYMYDASGGLVVHEATGEILSAQYRSGKTELYPVDPTWLGTHLGLVSLVNQLPPRELGDDFKKIAFQSYRVRVKPVGQTADAKKRNFPQEHITAFGNQMSRDTVERLIDSRKIPVLKN